MYDGGIFFDLSSGRRRLGVVASSTPEVPLLKLTLFILTSIFVFSFCKVQSRGGARAALNGRRSSQ